MNNKREINLAKYIKITVQVDNSSPSFLVPSDCLAKRIDDLVLWRYGGRYNWTGTIPAQGDEELTIVE